MKRKYVGLLAIIGLAAFLFGASPAFAVITLGNAQRFAVLGGQTVTNIDGTVITTGDVGLSPGFLAAITGFPPGLILGGAKHAADTDGLAAAAQADLITAYNAAEDPVATPCTLNLSGQDLGPVGGAHTDAGRLLF